MPTLVGARRRGFTPEGFRSSSERIGVAKGRLLDRILGFETAWREHLERGRPAQDRRARSREARHRELPVEKEECEARTTRKSRSGQAKRRSRRELWIEREDFSENPPKGYFRLFPGNKVRCATAISSSARVATRTRVAGSRGACKYDPDTKSGTAGAETVKVKATSIG